MKHLSDLAMKLEGQKMFQILSKAKDMERSGKDIIHFEIGDPDFRTPINIIEGAREALRKGETHYTSSWGLLELRVAASEVTLRSRGFKPDLNQLLVTPGANYQIRLALGCAVNPGEEVIIPDPCFVTYPSLITAMGITPIKISLHEENGFNMDPLDVENAITNKTRMIVINSPHNPTGSVMKEEEIKKIYEIAEKHDIYLLSDEIYARLLYKDNETIFSSPSKYDKCKERTILVNGFSKSYSMTGWRLGVVTGPSSLIEKMNLLLESEISCVSPFIQRAGIEALKGSPEKTFEMRDEFRKRRDAIVNGLNTLPGITCIPPKGAFYAFPNIKNTKLSSEYFAEYMLNEAGVAICPGNFFGEQGEGYVRLCYAANSLDNIDKGIARMRDALEHI